MPRVVLIGFPQDRGVRLNGGRAGAARGPAAIRRALYALTPGSNRVRRLLEHTIDAGDLAVSSELAADQARLGEAVGGWLTRGVVPIVIGGGHETAFGHFLGYVDAGLDVSILNWDAHADVRDVIRGRGHSGSPFRQAIAHQSGRCRRYTAAGLLRYVVAASHLEFIRERGGRAIWKDDLTKASIAGLYRSARGRTMVSFDLDALDGSLAPGVSAPSVGGMDLERWLDAAELAGRCPAVTSMDIAEMNPRFDRDGCTARAAALTIWRFLEGFATRRADEPKRASDTRLKRTLRAPRLDR